MAANNSYSELARGDKSNLRLEAVQMNKEPFSVLIMGIEDYSSDGKIGRTDTLMVATIDPQNKTANLLSIPRDTRVEISATRELDKINHAYNFGKDVTIETVENFLGIPIDFYVSVNFEAFKNIIDILGGITVYVPFDFYQNSDDRVAEKLYFYEGFMELDGRYALAYARMRKQDPRGDFGRMERQQEVVKAVIDKALSPGTLLKVDDLANEVEKNVETNIRISDALKLSKIFAGFDSSKINVLKIEGNSEIIDDIWYFIPDEESLNTVKQELRNHLNYMTEESYTAYPQ